MIRKFLRSVDEIVALTFFLVLLTSGGGPGMTEHEGITFINTESELRSVFFFHGWLGILSNSQKDTIVYTPPMALARLLLVLWGIIYPAAAILSSAIMDESSAGHYLSHPYVQSGQRMESTSFTAALKYHTYRRFGIALGIRDLRVLLRGVLEQTMGASFRLSDETSRAAADIDAQTGHSTGVANAHYGIDEKALPNLSNTEIAMHQRVSLKWHLFLGLLSEQHIHLIVDDVMVSLKVASLCLLLTCFYSGEELSSIARNVPCSHSPNPIEVKKSDGEDISACQFRITANFATYGRDIAEVDTYNKVLELLS